MPVNHTQCNHHSSMHDYCLTTLANCFCISDLFSFLGGNSDLYLISLALTDQAGRQSKPMWECEPGKVDDGGPLGAGRAVPLL